MSFSQSIARLVTQRRALVWTALGLLSALCIFILVTRIRLDSEVLNLLPRGFESVEGLKIYNRDFAHTRERDQGEPFLRQAADVDRLEEFAPVFAERLRKQPWWHARPGRFSHGNAGGCSRPARHHVPLLLNLEPQTFDEALRLLDPAKIQERLHRLHNEIEAGSPRPEFELSFDPLAGAPALKPFSSNASIEEEQPLTSPDRTTRVFLAVTNQNPSMPSIARN
jgi:hypothetical protein